MCAYIVHMYVRSTYICAATKSVFDYEISRDLQIDHLRSNRISNRFGR